MFNEELLKSLEQAESDLIEICSQRIWIKLLFFPRKQQVDALNPTNSELYDEAVREFSV